MSSNKTRLGGDIIHITMTCGKEAFVKIGTGFEKLEIIRQYKNISILQGHLPIPKIYDYVNGNHQAIIVLERIPGLPIHQMISNLSHQSILLIIKDILDKIYQIPSFIKKNFEVGVSQELLDIKNLIDNKKVKQNIFYPKNLSLKQAYEKIENDLKNHTTQTLSHGDLCLPNIIVTQSGEWSLIDLGKCGLGDPCRDLYSLKISTKRNIDQTAFFELCEMMNFKIAPQFQEKINLYKMIDLFWYNTTRE